MHCDYRLKTVVTQAVAVAQFSSAEPLVTTVPSLEKSYQTFQKDKAASF